MNLFSIFYSNNNDCKLLQVPGSKNVYGLGVNWSTGICQLTTALSNSIRFRSLDQWWDSNFSRKSSLAPGLTYNRFSSVVGFKF